MVSEGSTSWPREINRAAKRARLISRPNTSTAAARLVVSRRQAGRACKWLRLVPASLQLLADVCEGLQRGRAFVRAADVTPRRTVSLVWAPPCRFNQSDALAPPAIGC
jgi:hypothetical protein